MREVLRIHELCTQLCATLVSNAKRGDLVVRRCRPMHTLDKRPRCYFSTVYRPSRQRGPTVVNARSEDASEARAIASAVLRRTLYRCRHTRLKHCSDGSSGTIYIPAMPDFQNNDQQSRTLDAEDNTMRTNTDPEYIGITLQFSRARRTRFFRKCLNGPKNPDLVGPVEFANVLFGGR